MNLQKLASPKYINWDAQQKTLTLQTNASTYQIKIDEAGSLLHTWYGAKHSGNDYSYLIELANHSCSGNPSDMMHNRGYSFDTLPQELPQVGTGDFRVTALDIEWPDGSHGTDLRYYSHDIYQGKYKLEGLPSFEDRGADCETLVIILKDRHSDLYVNLYYAVFPKCDLITRCSEVINKTGEQVRVHNIASGVLDLMRGEYQVLHFAGRHNHERQITETKLTQGIFSLHSGRGTSSHQQNPSLIIKTQQTQLNQGEAYALALVYSGGFDIDFELDQIGQTRVVAGLDKSHFCWNLKSCASLQSPELALTYSQRGTNGVSQNMHQAINNHLISAIWSKKSRPVLINNWEATYFDFTKDKLLEIAKTAKELGFDLFVLDDGWFGKRNNDEAGLGDWQPNVKKLGGSLGEFATEINQIGLDFGIWIEPEMINEDSDLYRSHPDWAIAIPNREPNRSRGQLVLDFSRKDVQDYLIKCIDAILQQATIKYVKWDMNRSICDWYSHTLDKDAQGEQAHRYVLGVYRVLDYLKKTYPSLLIEGCSGGGGRFDLGMLYYVPQFWTSDDTDAIERLSIQAGTAAIYPISSISAHASAVPNHQNHRITPLFTRGIVAMQGAFGYEMDLTKLTDAEKLEVKWQIAFYKQYEELIRNGRYYALAYGNGKAWQFVSENTDKSLLACVYTKLSTSAMNGVIHWCGLNNAYKYKITLYTCHKKQVVLGEFLGEDLMVGGLPLVQAWCEYDTLCFVAEKM